MACKACHKSKVLFVQGRRYSNNGEEYLCARVGKKLYALVGLTHGNRWNEPSDLQKVGNRTIFKEVKYYG